MTTTAADVIFRADLRGPRVGAMAYHAAHSYVGPVLAGLAALLSGRPRSRR